MKIGFKNFGAIRCGELTVDKNLTVLVGPNGSGKTYCAYILYGLSSLLPISNVKINIINEFLLENISESFEINLEDVFINHKQSIEVLIGNILKEKVPLFFASPISYFHDSEFFVEFDNVEKYKNNIYKLGFNWNNNINYTDYSVNFFKESNNPVLKVSFLQKPKQKSELEKVLESIVSNETIVNNEGLDEFIDQLEVDIFEWMIVGLIENSRYIATSERSAINLFSRELYNRRASLVNQLTELQIDGTKIPDIAKLIENNTKRYHLPIIDSLELTGEYDVLSKNTSKFVYLAEEIESKILKGKIELSDIGEFRYKSNSMDQQLDLHISASIVKSLAFIVFYFKHIANTNQVLIIDEPELNLHPDMQCVLARVLARAANSGIQIVISTHSNFIIKELNALIMMNSLDDNKEEFVISHNYDMSELLSENNLGIYLFNDGQIVNVKPNVFGFDIDSINDTIDNQNVLLQELMYRMNQ